MEYDVKELMKEEYRYFRSLHPVSMEAIRELICKVYGWEHWSEDPWGNSRCFYEWLTTTRDSVLAVWAINETPGGRYYLARTYDGLVEEDYSKWTVQELMHTAGLGFEEFLWVRVYSGWKNFRFPSEPLPTKFVNEKILKVFRMPLSGYIWDLGLIFNLGLAYDEITRRIGKHPELEGLVEYAAATDPQCLENFRLFGDARYPADKGKGFEKLEAAMKKPLEGLSWKYKDVFPLHSKVEGSTLDEGYVEAQGRLLDAANDWKKKDFIVAGLEGRLGNSLLSIVKHDFADAAGKAYRKHEDTESQIDTQRKAQGEEDDTAFFDTLPSREPTPEEQMLSKEPIHLKELGLNIDKLKPKGLWIILDVHQGFKEGCSFDSKQGLSFRVRWGKDYDKNIKAYNRAKTKLKQL